MATGRRWLAWAPAVVVTHLWVGVAGALAGGAPFGDLAYYSAWADRLWATGAWPDSGGGPWVYPAGAVVPLAMVGLLADPGHGYLIAWFALVTAVNGVVTVALARRRPAAAWWWLGFVAAAGPVAVARLEPLAGALVVAGLLLAARRPLAAGALWAAGAWVKVWPVVVVGAAAAARPAQTLYLAAGVLLVTVPVVAAGAAVADAPGGVFGFVAAQTARGVQVESLAGMVLGWARWAGKPVDVEFDAMLVTYRVSGWGEPVAAVVTEALLPVAAAAVLLIAVRARRRGADPAQVLVLTAFAGPLVLFAANKVGSPQYLLWAAPAVAVALTAPSPSAPAWRSPAIGMLGAAALSHLLYPFLYSSLLASELPGLLVLTARNMLLVGGIVWAVTALLLLPGSAGHAHRCVKPGTPARSPSRRHPSGGPASRSSSRGSQEASRPR